VAEWRCVHTPPANPGHLKSIGATPTTRHCGRDFHLSVSTHCPSFAWRAVIQGNQIGHESSCRVPQIAGEFKGSAQHLGQPLQWWHPAERLARPSVELASDTVELALGVH